MEKLKEIMDNIWFTRITHSLIIIIVSVIIYKIICFVIDKSEEKTNFKLFTSNKGKTYLKLLKSIIRSIIIMITILIILQTNGINVSSVLAGVGIFGVVFGLAIQDWLKDIIRGSSIISDSYFSVGDVVKYHEIEGKVLVIGLKTTRIRDLRTNNIISIANRNIDEVEVVSNWVHIKVPVPYDIKVEKAEKAIDDIIKLIKANKNVDAVSYLGVTELADSSIDYYLRVECNPEFNFQVRRDALRSILLGLEANNIEVPFTQIDIHNK